MKRSCCILFILSLLIISCRPTKPATDESFKTIETASGKWELVWNDEFDYEGLPDPEKWNFDTEGNNWGWGNNELQCYTSHSKENAFVENGKLKITALNKKMNGKEYTSARLTTKNKGDWKYGRVEVKAKLPGGLGTWSAIWMLPTDNVYEIWPGSGEIDIMEHVGYSPDSIFSTVHTVAYNHTIGTQVGETIESKNATTGFQVYSLEWEENELRSYVDDKCYFTFTNEHTGSEAWPFDQRFYLLLNLAIGGNLGGKFGVNNALFPHVMEVDYVRIYKKTGN